MGGGVSGYAAISARVRAMYSTLLTPQDFARLDDAAEFNALIGGLKNTIYGRYLGELKDRELTPRRVLIQIKNRLADAYDSVIHMSPEHTRPLLLQLYRFYELSNLKAILRSLAGGSDSSQWERVREVLFPFGAKSALPAQAAMIESGSVSAAVDLLRGTPYEEPLSFAMKRYSVEQNLFPLEVLLDLEYWRRLWAEAKKLKGLDREQALWVIGSLVDTNNLMWVIRYRVYHQLSEEELINYTLPFGYQVRDEDIRSIAAGGDIPPIIRRVFPGIADVNALLEDPKSGLPKLETQFKRHVMKRCMSEFAGNPFHIGIPLAFLVLCGLEIQDLTVLIEAKSSRLAGDAYRPFLLKANLAV